MKIFKVFFLLLGFLFVNIVNAEVVNAQVVNAQVVNAQVVTVDLKSSKMDVSVKNNIILPDNYSTSNKRYPVLYLLHGYSGNYNSWLEVKRDLPEIASYWQIIIVTPDGKNSWFWDSPVDPQSKYESYIVQDLLPFIDKTYRTIASSEGRAITGLSMGGHGGLWLGINYPNLFGAYGSMSGGVDIRPYTDRWEISDKLGNYADNRDRWNDHTVINQLDKIQPTAAIIIDCGTDDFFFKDNENLHNQLLARKIPHDYIARPGGHTREYWNNSIDYQVMFFAKHFKENSRIKEEVLKSTENLLEKVLKPAL